LARRFLPQISTLNLLQQNPLQKIDNSRIQIYLQETSTKFIKNSIFKMTTFAEEVTQHLELFIKHLTDNNEVINEYNEEFLVDATIISLKARGTIQSHLEETNARLIFYTYIREYKQQQFYRFMQDQQPPSST
jgi:hypothetical protein